MQRLDELEKTLADLRLSSTAPAAAEPLPMEEFNNIDSPPALPQRITSEEVAAPFRDSLSAIAATMKADFEVPVRDGLSLPSTLIFSRSLRADVVQERPPFHLRCPQEVLREQRQHALPGCHHGLRQCQN